MLSLLTDEVQHIRVISPNPSTSKSREGPGARLSPADSSVHSILVFHSQLPTADPTAAVLNLGHSLPKPQPRPLPLESASGDGVS